MSQTIVCTFVEDGFNTLYSFPSEDFAAGFAEGFTSGASEYGAGSCMAVRWPVTAEEKADIIENYDEEQFAKADAAAHRAMPTGSAAK